MSAVAQKTFLVGSVFCVTFAAAAQLSQVQPSGHTPDVSIKSEEARSPPGSKKPQVMRREQMETPHEEDKVWKPAEAIFAEISASAGHHEAAGAETNAESKNADLYILAGKKRCNGPVGAGGGQWKHYKLSSMRPGKYSYTAAACDSKEECVGFDVGPSGSHLYTTKPVAMGTWVDVLYDDGEAFPGDGVHNQYVSSPDELHAGTVENDAQGNPEHWECYRKTFYKPKEAYYYTIGHGTCSGGGLWKRYRIQPATYMQCEHACSMRDECIGFDFGTWEIGENTQQMTLTGGDGTPYFQSTMVTQEGCFMYTQKPVWGTWPGVQAGAMVEDGENQHDAFPSKPDELRGGFIASYNVAPANATGVAGQVPTKCYGKSHWVGLDSYYIELGKNYCSGGGAGYGYHKHYKSRNVNKQACQDACDEQDGCVGYDHGPETDGTEVCRLYTMRSIQSGTWPHVNFGENDEAFPGSTAESNQFASSPFKLIPAAGTLPGVTCTVKTHFETEGQALGEGEGR